jgi:hypothetical protein
MNVAEPGHDVSRAEHPLSLRLSRIMELGAQDLRFLERVIQTEQLVKKRKDLVVVGNEFRAISASSGTATQSATSCFATGRGRSST